MRLSLERFAGIRPKIASELLAGNEAQIAKNCKLSNGHLRPWYNELERATLVNTGTIRTIYLYEGSHWFEWEADVDVVLAPVSGDTAGKFYFTGAGIPKKSNRTQATTGAGAKPINYYPLAVPTPAVAPTATLGSGGTGDARSVNYVWTVVTDWYEEGLPSDPSNTVSAKQGQTVNLSGITLEWQAGKQYDVGNFVFPVGQEGGTYVYKCVQAGTSGASEPSWGTTIDGDTTDGTVKWRCYKNNLLQKRIYRVLTGSVSAQYVYLDAIDISDTTYTDTTPDDDLNTEDVLLTETYDPPPDELQGLVYIGNGILAGFTGKDIYFSEPYKPWAYPTDYVISVPDPIVALETVAGVLVVLTEDKPVIVTGADSAAMTPTPLSESRPCVSKRSVAKFSGGVVYATNDGLALIDGSRSILLTRSSLDAETWPNFEPATMHGYIQDERYFGFYSYGDNEGAIVVGLFQDNASGEYFGELTTLDLYTDAAFVDTEEDILYFVKTVSGTNYVYQWEGDQTQPHPNTFVWRSKEFLLPAKATPMAARVICELGDRSDYQDLLDQEAQARARNIALISANQIGGAIGEDAIGSNISINGDQLEDVPDTPAYSGDFVMTFKLYADGQLKMTKEIYNDKPFRLIAGYRARTLYFQVEGNLEIKRIDLAASMEEIKAQAK